MMWPRKQADLTIVRALDNGEFGGSDAYPDQQEVFKAKSSTQ